TGRRMFELTPPGNTWDALSSHCAVVAVTAVPLNVLSFVGISIPLFGLWWDASTTTHRLRNLGVARRRTMWSDRIRPDQPARRIDGHHDDHVGVPDQGRRSGLRPAGHAACGRRPPHPDRGGRGDRAAEELDP